MGGLHRHLHCALLGLQLSFSAFFSKQEWRIEHQLIPVGDEPSVLSLTTLLPTLSWFCAKALSSCDTCVVSLVMLEVLSG